MAETPSRTSFKKYYSIFQGKFARRVDKGTEGAVTRTTTPKKGTGKEVHELHFESLSGKIKSIEIEQTDFGKQYKVSMSDVGDEMVISLAVDSNFGDSFMSKILNVNFSQDVELKPYSFTTKDTGKKREGINIFQNNEKVAYFFTKEEPKGKPQPESDKMDSDDWKVYNIQVRKFYAKVLEQKVIPAIQEANKPTTPPASVAQPQDEDSDDLPF